MKEKEAGRREPKKEKKEKEGKEPRTRKTKFLKLALEREPWGVETSRKSPRRAERLSEQEEKKESPNSGG